MTHTELCNLGAKWLKSNGLVKWQKPKYIVVEIESIGIPQPDIYGFGNCKTQQIEVKVSRSDFLADKKKYHMQFPDKNVGQYRSYLCPYNMIKESDLPEKWGLLWVDENKRITVIKHPEIQESHFESEMTIISSILRRIEVKPQIFSFKNHKISEQTPVYSVCP